MNVIKALGRGTLGPEPCSLRRRPPLSYTPHEYHLSDTSGPDSYVILPDQSTRPDICVKQRLETRKVACTDSSESRSGDCSTRPGRSDGREERWDDTVAALRCLALLHLRSKRTFKTGSHWNAVCTPNSLRFFFLSGAEAVDLLPASESASLGGVFSESLSASTDLARALALGAFFLGGSSSESDVGLVWASANKLSGRFSPFSTCRSIPAKQVATQPSS